MLWSYFRKAEILDVFERLDQWIRRKLRCIVWRQWKRPSIRERQLKRRGILPADAKTAAYNGRGPWYNAGSRWVGKAIPTAELRKLGLVPLVEAQQRLACRLNRRMPNGTSGGVGAGGGQPPPATRSSCP